MASYKQLFFMRFANSNGNIKKGTKAEEVWSSMEEFLRLVLAPKPKKKKTKTTNSPLGKVPPSATATHLAKKKNG